MKKGLVILVFTLIPTFAFAQQMSFATLYSASGSVIPAVTITKTGDIVFENDLIAGTQPSPLCNSGCSGLGCQAGSVTVSGCQGSSAFASNAATLVITAGSTSYTINMNSTYQFVNTPGGASEVFSLYGCITLTAPLVAGGYSGTLTVTAGCAM